MSESILKRNCNDKFRADHWVTILELGQADAIHAFSYLILMYIPQPRTQHSGPRVSQEIIFRKWILWKIELIEPVSNLQSFPYLFSHLVHSNRSMRHSGWNMIKEWSSNFCWMRKLILATWQTYCRHSLVNMWINLEWFNCLLQKYGWVVKTSMVKLALKDLLLRILIRKFWLSEINILANRLNR
jgi:hypothetical protein